MVGLAFCPAASSSSLSPPHRCRRFHHHFLLVLYHLHLLKVGQCEVEFLYQSFVNRWLKCAYKDDHCAQNFSLVRGPVPCTFAPPFINIPLSHSSSLPSINLINPRSSSLCLRNLKKYPSPTLGMIFPPPSPSPKRLPQSLQLNHLRSPMKKKKRSFPRASPLHKSLRLPLRATVLPNPVAFPRLHFRATHPPGHGAQQQQEEKMENEKDRRRRMLLQDV